MDFGIDNQKIESLKKASHEARGSIIKMTSLAKSGHPGGSMSTIDLMMAVYEIANVNPANYKKDERDIVLVSNGHISPAVYSSLAHKVFFDINDAISQFRLAGSKFEGHIERAVPGVEWATGNLGQGLSAACGFALAGKLKGNEKQVFCFMGDGEQQKGQIGEARRFAVKFGLNNITAIIDYNQLQISGDISNVMPQDIAGNFTSDGWEVISVDGHDFNEIFKALADAKKSDKPVMILAHTIMGKDVSFMENDCGYHGAPLKMEQLEKALVELKLDNNMDELAQMRANFEREDIAGVNTFSPDIKSEKVISYDDVCDNRSAWGNALVDVERENKESKTPLAVFDCDLAGSVKTKGFSQEAPERFFQSGIMEHNTSVVAGVLSTCGFQTFWSDFGMFGIDEVYNMHRLTDINEGNIKVAVTHVGLDVGEDGKTHQCIDYIGLMRNLYHFDVIVPADPNQTDRAVRYMTQSAGNIVIAMGRSKLSPIRKEDGSLFFDENYRFVYGKADQLRKGNRLAIVATGTLVNTAVTVADMLKAQGIDVQVWNVSSPLKISSELVESVTKTAVVFTLEDHNANSGLGLSLAEAMIAEKKYTKLVKLGVNDYACSGNSKDVFKMNNLDVDGVLRSINNEIKA